MDTYKTVLGDTWDIISFKVYGKETYVGQLMEANIKHIETVIFSAGTIINIPKIDLIQDDSALPPWKRGATSAST